MALYEGGLGQEGVGSAFMAGLESMGWMVLSPWIRTALALCPKSRVSPYIDTPKAHLPLDSSSILLMSSGSMRLSSDAAFLGSKAIFENGVIIRAEPVP